MLIAFWNTHKSFKKKKIQWGNCMKMLSFWFKLLCLILQINEFRANSHFQNCIGFHRVTLVGSHAVTLSRCVGRYILNSRFSREPLFSAWLVAKGFMCHKRTWKYRVYGSSVSESPSRNLNQESSPLLFHSIKDYISKENCNCRILELEAWTVWNEYW